MKKILLLLLLVVIWTNVNAKSLIVKTKVIFKLDTRTGEELERKESYSYFEFDPEEKKTIEVTTEGQNFIVNVRKYEMKREGNNAIIDFYSDKNMIMTLMQSLDSDFRAVYIVLGENPVVMVYATE